MAASPSPMAPPPGAPQSGPPPTSNPVGASPAPAQPNAKLEMGSQKMIQAVQAIRWIAQNFPAASKPASQINDLMRELQLAMMKGSQPGEAAAPPTAG